LHYDEKKLNNFYGEIGYDVVSEKSEAQIRTRKRREKISSFFKFWRPCSISVYFFIKIFSKRRTFPHVTFPPALLKNAWFTHMSLSYRATIRPSHTLC